MNGLKKNTLLSCKITLKLNDMKKDMSDQYII